MKHQGPSRFVSRINKMLPTDGRTVKPKLYAPLSFFEVGGIIKSFEIFHGTSLPCLTILAAVLFSGIYLFLSFSRT